LLGEAIRIGDALLASVQAGAYGDAWHTLTVESDQRIGRQQSVTIYNGTSGIVLFLLALHRQTGNAAYLEQSIRAMAGAVRYCQENPSNYYALFTGRMSVPFTLVKLHEATGDKDYLAQALDVARPCSAFNDSPIVDLINGVAGMVLGLLHLHQATREAWILAEIDAGVAHLLATAYHGKAGLAWQRSYQNTRGLCGFSHGAAGMGFVFGELGRYFGNPAFYWIADQAFLYERQFYDGRAGNWPDYRKGIYNPDDERKYQEAFRARNWDFFTQGGDTNFWCHGAAGIGLSRVRAEHLRADPLYAEEVRSAVRKTIRTDVTSTRPNGTFTLCHGAGGNAELFLEHYRCTGDAESLAAAETVGRRAVRHGQQHGGYRSGISLAKDQEDASLFLGNAGIGYFYLKLLQPLTTGSVLAPALDGPVAPVGTSHATLAVSTAGIKRSVLDLAFKRTLCLADFLFPQALRAHLEQPAPASAPYARAGFADFVAAQGQALPPGVQPQFLDLYHLESAKLALDVAVPSDTLLYMKKAVKAAQREPLLGAEDFLGATLVLDPDVQLVETRWDWSAGGPAEWLSNLAAPPQPGTVLLTPTTEGVVEQKISAFKKAVLLAFATPRSVADAAGEVASYFDLPPGSAAYGEAVSQIVQQIKKAIAGGLLMEADGTPEAPAAAKRPVSDNVPS
jgi:hypothetical protein